MAMLFMCHSIIDRVLSALSVSLYSNMIPEHAFVVPIEWKTTVAMFAYKIEPLPCLNQIMSVLALAYNVSQ